MNFMRIDLKKKFFFTYEHVKRHIKFFFNIIIIFIYNIYNVKKDLLK